MQQEGPFQLEQGGRNPIAESKMLDEQTRADVMIPAVISGQTSRRGRLERERAERRRRV